MKRKYSVVVQDDGHLGRPAPPSRGPTKRSVSATAERILERRRSARAAADGDEQDDGDHLMASKRFAKVLAVHHRAVEFVQVRDAISTFPEETKETALALLTTVGQNMVIEHRDIDPACSHLVFLFNEYEPRCWWFECAGAIPPPPRARASRRLLSQSASGASASLGSWSCTTTSPSGNCTRPRS